MDRFDVTHTLSQLKNQRGQAMAEMVLSIPVLFLFAAAVFQFALLFLSYIQFEHACGEAGREFAAGLVEKDGFGPEIIGNLGSFQLFFVQNSLNITVDQPHSMASSAFSDVSNIVGSLNSAAHTFHLSSLSAKYEGYFWTVAIKFKPPAFFRLLFPDGIDLKTSMEIYRYAG